MYTLEAKKCESCERVYDRSVVYCLDCGQSLIDFDPIIGRTLDGRYLIESVLGRGGMGVVYRATHIHIDSRVAVKVLHPELVADQLAIERFRREARATGRIQHPNAVQTTDFGVTEQGIVYLVMELVLGETLRSVIEKERPLAPRRSINILRQVCAAVQAAHLNGVIHRDLKPDNIVIQQIGQGSGYLIAPTVDGNERVKVLDFGIAKLRERATDGVAGTNAAMSRPLEKPLTEAGLVIGTPHYMSPEQCRARELDARSDVYSLGIILYELLTGELPFKDGTQMEIVIKQVKEAPRPPREINPSIPPALEAVILSAIAKEPDLRPSSAAELSEMIEMAIKDVALDDTDTSFDTNRSVNRDLTAAEIISGTIRIITGQHQLKSRRTALIALLTALILTAMIAAIVFVRGRHEGKQVESTQVEQPAPEPPVPAGMVLVEGGTFIMGRDDGLKKDEMGYEGPAHKVEVRSFLLDIYEVTNKQYKEFVDATGHPSPRHWRSRNSYPADQEDYPVTNVSWVDAVAFANWKGKRLPTEEEWEYAARGGIQNLLYPWGNSYRLGDANLAPERRRGVMAVGSYQRDRSRFGVFDLSGNVSEWVQNYYRPYNGEPQRQWRVFRGGNFREAPDHGTATYRFWDLPKAPDPSDMQNYKDYVDQMDRIGFRCAKDLGSK